jgi:hypothetical protein
MSTLTSAALGARRETERHQPRVATRPTVGGFDRDYWLRNCEGYRVDGAAGRLGFVESISEEPDGTPTLAVRAGRLGKRLLLIRACEVDFIVPRAERVWLATPIEIVGSEGA